MKHKNLAFLSGCYRLPLRDIFIYDDKFFEAHIYVYIQSKLLRNKYLLMILWWTIDHCEWQSTEECPSKPSTGHDRLSNSWPYEGELSLTPLETGAQW